VVVGGGHAAGDLPLSREIIDNEIRAARTDAINFSIQQPSQNIAGLINRKPDARRAAVDRQDAGRVRFYDSAPETKSYISRMAVTLGIT